LNKTKELFWHIVKSFWWTKC